MRNLLAVPLLASFYFLPMKDAYSDLLADQMCEGGGFERGTAAFNQCLNALSSPAASKESQSVDSENAALAVLKDNSSKNNQVAPDAKPASFQDACEEQYGYQKGTPEYQMCLDYGTSEGYTGK